MIAKEGWCFKTGGVDKFYVISLDKEGYTNLERTKYTDFSDWNTRDRTAIAPKELMFWTD